MDIEEIIRLVLAVCVVALNLVSLWRTGGIKGVIKGLSQNNNIKGEEEMKAETTTKVVTVEEKLLTLTVDKAEATALYDVITRCGMVSNVGEIYAALQNYIAEA